MTDTGITNATLVPLTNSEALKVFRNENYEVRSFVDDQGNYHFVAQDVCKYLTISNSRDALVKLDVDEKGVALTDTPGGKQEMLTVTEAGLYRLIGSSRKPEAKQFQRWIYHEVLPAIRKTGSYSVKPMTTAEGFYAAAVILRDHESRLTTLEQRVDTIQQTVTKKHYSYPIAGEPKKVNGRIFRLASSYLKRKGYKNDQESDDDAIRRYSREIYSRIKAMFRENYNINLDTERDQIIEDWNQRYLQGKINKDKTCYGKWTPDEIKKLSLVSEIAVSREWLSYFSEIMEELEAEEEGAVKAAARVQQRIRNPLNF